jgi:hypothetical protein
MNTKERASQSSPVNFFASTDRHFFIKKIKQRRGTHVREVKVV